MVSELDGMICDLQGSYSRRARLFSLLDRLNWFLGTFVLGMTMGIGISVGMAIAG